jgi:hypothetical protein
MREDSSIPPNLQGRLKVSFAPSRMSKPSHRIQKGEGSDVIVGLRWDFFQGCPKVSPQHQS